MNVFLKKHMNMLKQKNNFDLENFLINGYSFIDGLNIFDFFDIEILNNANISNVEKNGMNNIPPFIIKQISILEKKIKLILLESFKRVELVNKNPIIHCGIEKSTTYWHNDRCENFDCNVLCYIDDIDYKFGGTFHIKSNHNECFVVPRSGLILVINQSEKFLHRVEYTNQIRRKIEFKYKLS